MLFWKVTFISLIYYAVIGAILFLSAGTIHYPGGQRYMIITIIASSFLMYYFLYKDPSLIKLRLKGEVERKQKRIRFALTILFLILYILSGLDYRDNWSSVPHWLLWLAIFLLIIGYVFTFKVFDQNRFLASNIKVYEHQKLITTGLYAHVRHPMYSSAFIIMLATPIILGSFWALIPAVIACIVLVIRAKDEERILLRGFEGYKEYMRKVPYRFIPYVV